MFRAWEGNPCAWELPFVFQCPECARVPLQVAALLFGQFQSLIEMFYIIDCRYPYEYLGGHIKVREWDMRQPRGEAGYRYRVPVMSCPKLLVILMRYRKLFPMFLLQGALNLHRQEDLFELFLKRPLFPSMPQKRIVLVFHCEFSSERGPKM